MIRQREIHPGTTKETLGRACELGHDGIHVQICHVTDHLLGSSWMSTINRKGSWTIPLCYHTWQVIDHNLSVYK